MAAERELVGDAGTLCGEAVADGARGLLGVAGVGVFKRRGEVGGEGLLEGLDLGLGGVEDGENVRGVDAGSGGERLSGFGEGGQGFFNFELSGGVGGNRGRGRSRFLRCAKE